MKKTLFALLALGALAAACHERRQDPPIDDASVRAHADEAHRDLQRQSAPPAGDQGQ